jgi:hypothetical protein
VIGCVKNSVKRLMNAQFFRIIVMVFNAYIQTTSLGSLLIKQLIPSNVLKSVETSVDHSKARLTGTTKRARVKIALFNEPDRLENQIVKAFQPFVARQPQR